MVHLRAAVAAVLCCGVVLAGCGQDVAEDPAATASGEPMIVGVKYDQPLFGLETSEGVAGFDASLATEIAQRLGRDISFVEAKSAQREQLLLDGAVDMVVATYSITKARAKLVDFVGPYYIAHQDILVRAAEADSFTGVEDLQREELTFCTVRGSTSDLRVKREDPAASVVRHDTWSECRDDLIEGEVDAVTSDDGILTGLASAADGTDLVLVGAPFTDERYGIGVAPDSALQCEVSTVLAEIISDGTWAQIHADTIGDALGPVPDPPKPRDGC